MYIILHKHVDIIRNLKKRGNFKKECLFPDQASSTNHSSELSVRGSCEQGTMVPVKALPIIATQGHFTSRAPLSGVAVPARTSFNLLAGTQYTGLQFAIEFGDGNMKLACDRVTTFSNCVQQVILSGRELGVKGLFRGWYKLGGLVANPA